MRTNRIHINSTKASTNLARYTNGHSRIAREQRILWGLRRARRGRGRTADVVPTFEDFLAFEEACADEEADAAEDAAREAADAADDDDAPLSVASFIERGGAR